MSDVAIRAVDIGKLYRLAPSHLQNRSLREDITSAFPRVFGKIYQNNCVTSEQHHEFPKDFWALQEITFDVKRGETVGLIGGNGSGKSTLLKILSRIVAPTTGKAQIRGRVGALLEVGTGFHPELTGRDNVFMNGSILGMTRPEIQRRFDAIVEFAGVERFLGLPVKRYSSGMTLRLAFAVAAHLEPEILIVDEVLAVGDAEFERKCLARMDEVSQSGCTVFFVSHNLGAVRRLCTRAILLREGRLVEDGPTPDIISRYLKATGTRVAPNEWASLSTANSMGTAGASFESVRYRSASASHSYRPSSLNPLEIEVTVTSKQRVPGTVMAATIYDQLGTKLINADSQYIGCSIELPEGRSVWRFNIDSLYLKPGRYILGLWLSDYSGRTIDSKPSAVQFDVVSLNEFITEAEGHPQLHGIVPCQFTIAQCSMGHEV
jgi:lipopolysaccharide transport system ATP-binding protein